MTKDALLRKQIADLEHEWDRLDSTGRYAEQHDVERKLEQLRKELESLPCSQPSLPLEG